MKDFIWFPVVYMLGFAFVLSITEIAATTLQVFRLVALRSSGVLKTRCYEYLYDVTAKYVVFGLSCWLVHWIFFKWHSDSRVTISLGLLGGLLAVKGTFRNSKDEFYEKIKDSIDPDKIKPSH
jgi:hypothetical protein